MKLYLNGAENQRDADLLLSTEGVKYVSLSFKELYRAYDDEQRWEIARAFIDKGIGVAIHSGFHSINEKIWLQYNAETGILDPLDLPQSIKDKLEDGFVFEDLKEDFVNKHRAYESAYIKFVGRYGSHFDYVQELSIPRFGPIYKRQHRDKLLQTGAKVMFLHDRISDLVIEDLNNPGVSIVGLCRVDPIEIMKLINTRSNNIIEHGYKLHGVSLRNTDEVVSAPWYSGDIGFWNSGARFGRVYEYKGKLDFCTFADNIKDTDLGPLVSQAKSLGLDSESFLKGNLDSINEWNLHQFIRYSKDLEYLRLGVEYWLSEDQKNDLINKYREDTGVALTVRSITTGVESYSDIPKGITKHCNTCVLATNCPKYEAGASCAYLEPYQGLNLKTKERVDDAASTLAHLMFVRAVDAYNAELMSGGSPSESTTELMREAMKALSDLNTMRNKGASVTISASGDKGVGVIGALLNRATEVSNKNPAGRTIDMDRNRKSKIDIEDATIVDE